MHTSSVYSSGSFDKCVQLYSQLPPQTRYECLPPLKSLCLGPGHSHPASKGELCAEFHPLDQVCLFSRHVLLWVWLLLHNIMSLRSICVVACVGSVFPSVAEQNSDVWDTSLPLCSPSGQSLKFQQRVWNVICLQSEFAFPQWLTMHVFLCLLVTCIIFICEESAQVFCPFF